jgi:hypothetical protein
MTVMTKEDIIHMAREAGLIYWTHNRWWMDAGEFGEEIERFAALIASHIRETEFKPDWNNYRQGFADGAAEEREACAGVLDEMADDMVREMEPSTAVAYVRSKAAAIRERSANARARGENKMSTVSGLDIANNIEREWRVKCGTYINLLDANAKELDRAMELLRRAENEMRYAGWTKFESDNPARNGVYEQVKRFLK